MKISEIAVNKESITAEALRNEVALIVHETYNLYRTQSSDYSIPAQQVFFDLPGTIEELKELQLDVSKKLGKETESFILLQHLIRYFEGK